MEHSVALKANSSVDRLITPLWAVLLFTFTNSIGSAISNAGIYFLAESRFGFTKAESFGIGVLYGVVYIPAAMLVGPLLRRLPQGSAWANPRGVLCLVMLLMAGVCLLPTIVPQAWTVWVFILVYSPLAGMLWPITESYVSGGRSGRVLRSAIGRFNIAWSSALVIGLLAMAPYVKSHPLTVLLVLAGVHGLTTLVLAGFSRAPAAHNHEEHEPHPESYTRLLSFVRVLLPTAFMFLAALAPYLATARKQLGLSEQAGPILASVWMAARVATFFLLERWLGWHGKWTTPLLGVGCLLLGFAAVVLAPSTLGASGPALPVFVSGLAIFGVGVGVIYCAALYYAMEVGSAQVDAGGTHEMLIGIGYTIGPVCGLAGALLIRDPASVRGEQLMLVLISTLGVLATGFALWSARQSTPVASEGPKPKLVGGAGQVQLESRP